MPPADILTLSLAEIEAWCDARRVPRYRARQVTFWLYQRGVRDFTAMTNVPRSLRDDLAASFRIGSLNVARVSRSHDGTTKLLFRLPDDATIESVLIPDGGRLTLCASTQVGCAMGCRFCATAMLGLRRHLTRGEIVEQFLLARTQLGEAEGGAMEGLGSEPIGREAPLGADPSPSIAPPPRITNLVFMGMGEPLHNYAATVGAIETLTASWGVDFSHRRVTVSTVGLVPEMQRLLAETRVQLAVSLAAVDQALRLRLTPVAKKYPVAELLEACRELPLPRRKRVTFEYVMLGGVNDGIEQARALVRALAGIRCKVNLIPFNLFSGAGYARSDDITVMRFQDALHRAGIHATVRESRGPDIAAACGQLVAEECRPVVHARAGAGA